jgi:NAD(P)-dependent dehydrogenase (short-subunit alcohol dehydrogenase family)
VSRGTLAHAPTVEVTVNRLKDRTALVIGGSTGIGREVVLLFAREGADVAVGDVGPSSERDSLVGEIERLGRIGVQIDVDVSVESMVAIAIQEAIRRFGHIDILVNNAGIAGYRGSIQEQARESWDEIMSVNLTGMFLGMKHVLPHMISRRFGRIINTASSLAQQPTRNAAAYCASKAATVALTQSVARDVATHGITVNCVSPGPTNTRLWAAGNEEAKARAVALIPMQRVAEPSEVAPAYVFLASDDGSYVTGQSISPNGGQAMP